MVNLGGYVTILLGKGHGTFETGFHAGVGGFLAGVGAEPESITIGDFNNDGFIDFATADYNSGTVSILINNTSPPPASQVPPSENVCDVIRSGYRGQEEALAMAVARLLNDLADEQRRLDAQRTEDWAHPS